MKFAPYLFAFLLPLAACQSKEGPAVEAQAAPTPRATAPPPAGDNTLRSYTFRGSLDGKIPVVLAFALRDSVAQGQVLYLHSKAKTPIALYGHLEDSLYVLYELTAEGTVTGLFSGKIRDGAFEGIWYPPGNGRERNFRLPASDTAFRAEAPVAAPAAEVAGTYRYDFGDGPVGELEFHPEGDSLRIEGQSVTGPPAHNIADLAGERVRLQGHTAYWENHEGACRIRFRFYRGFLVVDHPTARYNCGFGNNADVMGVYRKTQ